MPAAPCALLGLAVGVLTKGCCLSNRFSNSVSMVDWNMCDLCCASPDTPLSFVMIWCKFVATLKSEIMQMGLDTYQGITFSTLQHIYHNSFN